MHKDPKNQKAPPVRAKGQAELHRKAKRRRWDNHFFSTKDAHFEYIASS